MPKLQTIIDLEPSISPSYGCEPSLRRLVENYYAAHFENFEDYADEYFTRLQGMLDAHPESISQTKDKEQGGSND